MTRKDFRILARLLLRLKPEIYNLRFTFWDEMVHLIADSLEHHYPKFQRERFLVACGVQNDTETQP